MNSLNFYMNARDGAYTFDGHAAFYYIPNYFNRCHAYFAAEKLQCLLDRLISAYNEIMLHSTGPR